MSYLQKEKESSVNVQVICFAKNPYGMMGLTNVYGAIIGSHELFQVLMVIKEFMGISNSSNKWSNKTNKIKQFQ